MSKTRKILIVAVLAAILSAVFAISTFAAETGTLYTDATNGDVTYSLDGDTLTLTFPASMTSIPRLSGGTSPATVSDATLKAMLNEAKTVIIKGNGLTALGKQAFMAFRNTETLVIPNTIVTLSGAQTFNNCHNLKTLATYASEDEIDTIVTNPTIGLIDLSCITAINSSEQFAGAFRWEFENTAAASLSTKITPPATLTIKFGNLSTGNKSSYATKALQIFAGFSNKDTGYGTTPLVISVLDGSDFEADAQTYVDGVKDGDGKIGNVTPSSVTVVPYTEEAKVITGDLYEGITYSYLDTDPTTLTIIVPAETTSLPRLSNKVAADLALMLNNAKTVILKGSDLTAIASQAFYGFRNMETLVMSDAVTKLSSSQTFMGCANLKTVAVYASEDEIADIVANPTVGLIDLSCITSVGGSEQFMNAFRWSYVDNSATTPIAATSAPATLTIKLGVSSTAMTASRVFASFSNANGYGTTPLVISVLKGTDFATDAQTFVAGLTAGKIGNVTPSSVTVVPYTKEAKVITGTLYGSVTYSYYDTDPTTITITFPDDVTSLPRISGGTGTVSDSTLKAMLNDAKTIIIKGSGLKTTSGDSLFYGFRNMETLVWPSTITTLSNTGTFGACANLKTVAPYASEDEISDIVANPTVGLIDLSNITTIKSTGHFGNAFRWSFTQTGSGTTVVATDAPATLTIKFGDLSAASSAPENIFLNFSNATGYVTSTPVVIEVVYGTDFATAAQTYVNGLTGGKIGNVTPSSVTVKTYGEPPAPELIEDTLYGEVTYSYMSNDPTTITITFPDETASIPQFYAQVKTDATKVNMLNAATTIIIKGSGLTNISASATFYGFRNMETLVWPSTITAINASGSLSACANLKTVAPYASEDEIDAIVANPTVGLIDLSNITTIKSVDHFKNAFAWTYTDTNVTTTTAPSTLTIKFGNVTTGTPADIFANFGRTDGKGYGTTPLVIEVAYGDFATATQTYVNGLTGGKIGYVTPSSINVSVYGEPPAPVEITGTLYGSVTYSYWNNDPTTITITYPDETTSLVQFYTNVKTDSDKLTMLNNAKTVIIKGKGLNSTGASSLFYGFRNMETLVWPSTIKTINNSGAFAACAHLKTIAPYTSEEEIDAIVANPTVGLIDLSNITTIKSTGHFENAFRWNWGQTTAGAEVVKTTAPATLTIKIGRLSAASSTPSDIFSKFSNADGYVTTTPVVISVAYSNFATATQTYVNGLTAGKLGNVTPASVTARVYGEPQFITDTLYGEVTYSYWDNDPATITITFPDEIDTLPRISGTADTVPSTDTEKVNLLNAAKTIIIKGKGLVKTSGDSLFYGFRNMETLVIPSTITSLGSRMTFNNCCNLKTVATYASEDEIDAIVANPTVGLIDLSCITSIVGASQFTGAFRWSYTLSNPSITKTEAPEKLTIKFGKLSVTDASIEDIFTGFQGEAGVPVEISVLNSPAFAADAQAYFTALKQSGTALGNVSADDVYLLISALSAKQIGVRYNGDKNGLRYEFKFDKEAWAYMESVNNLELVEYGVIFASAANKANATLSKDGNGEYVTSSSKIKKTAIVQNGDWAENAKIVGDSDTETIFAGTMVNWTEKIYKTEAYICAYLIYRDAEGVETINYISYGDVKGQSVDYATCSLSKIMNYMLEKDQFAGATVSETSIWNTLLFGADTLGSSKELSVNENTVAILVDGIVVVRSLDGTAITDTSAAVAMVEGLGKTVNKAVSVTVGTLPFQYITINGRSISEYKIYSTSIACSNRLAENIVKNFSGQSVHIATTMNDNPEEYYIVLNPTSLNYTHYDVELDGNNLIVSGSYKSCYEFLNYFVEKGKTKPVNIKSNFSGDIDRPDLYTKEELMYVLKAVYNEDSRLIIGQETNADTKTPYAGSIDIFFNATGEYPGLVGVDLSWAGLCLYEGARGQEKATPELTSQAFCEMVEYAEKGGIFTVGSHFLNPNRNNGGLDFVDNADRNQHKGYLGADQAFADVIKSGTTLNNNFKAELDTNIEFLKACDEIGLALIWRPFHEMNTNYFWWCLDQKTPDASIRINSQSFKNLWIYVYNQFAAAGLDNLLWHYCPDVSWIDNLRAYPGNTYCDIVGTDWYSRTYKDADGNLLGAEVDKARVELDYYESWWLSPAEGPNAGIKTYPLSNLMTKGKPVGIGELGTMGDNKHDSSMDYVEDLRFVFAKGGKLAYALTWNGHGFDTFKDWEAAMETGMFITRNELVNKYFPAARAAQGN